MTKKFLILGLGNPGKTYQNTRHNIGWNFVSWLKDQYQTSSWQIEKKNFAQISVFENQNKKIIFALPLVFMNETGKTIKQLQKYYQVLPKNIIVVHDDNDIYVGNFKFSFDRGSAGHKGVEAIIKNLGLKKFYRLRIGIQPKREQRKKAENLVLKKFSPKERETITENFVLMKKAVEEKIKS